MRFAFAVSVGTVTALSTRSSDAGKIPVGCGFGVASASTSPGQLAKRQPKGCRTMAGDPARTRAWTVANLEAEIERAGLAEADARTLAQLAEQTATRCELIDPDGRVEVLGR